jgi:hypothetical protein
MAHASWICGSGHRSELFLSPSYCLMCGGHRRPQTLARPMTSSDPLSQQPPLWATIVAGMLLLWERADGRPGAPTISGKRAKGEDARGRNASSPSEIPARGWKDIFWRICNNFSEHRVLAIAAGVTFYLRRAGGVDCRRICHWRHGSGFPITTLCHWPRDPVAPSFSPSGAPVGHHRAHGADHRSLAHGHLSAHGLASLQFRDRATFSPAAGTARDGWAAS